MNRLLTGSVLKAYGSQASNVMETVENQPQFVGIMTAYGQSFMLPDINIFQQNLSALDTLHSKCKLYHKVYIHHHLPHINPFTTLLFIIIIKL